MAPQQNVVSLRPSDMVQGGLIDDIDVEIAESKFALFDYNGTQNPWTCLRLALKDEDGALHEQYFRAGDPKHFVPSSDGNEIVATGEKGALNRDSNYFIFISSLVNAGFPEPNLDEGARALVGARVHVLRKPAPKRSGIVQEEGKREQSVLTVTALLAMPGEQKKGGNKKAAPTAAAKTTAGKPAAAAQPADADMDTELQQLVLEALSENSGSIEKRQLVPFIFRKAQGANKKAMVKRVAEDDFLSTGMAEGLWLYEDETVTAA